MRRRTLLALAAACALPARGEELVTDVVPAGFRDAEELAAVVRPLVPAPGSVQAFAGQLVIRTSAANLREIKRVLQSLDTPPANLRISVRRSLDAEVRRDLAAAAARLSAGDAAAGGRGADAAFRARVERSISTREGSDVQTLRVLEGEPAFIHTGESVPVGERAVVVTGSGVTVAEGVRYEEFGTGFTVRARLSGERVSLEIVPQRRERRGDGSALTSGAGTTVSGRLGEWMEIASVGADRARGERALGAAREITTRRSDAIYLRVERID